MRHTAFAFALALLLGACGGSPPVHYHALPTPDGEAGRPAALGAPVVVGPVRVPAFLSRPYIAWRAGDSRLDYDELHRWGSSLEAEVLRALVEHLAHRLPGRGVLAWPTQVPAERALRVAVDIDRLDVVRGGTSR
ncbi:MAG: membrane integrity-associated transporter subunit PqiC, partial [Myxococcales bacterium]|nr:membrane integrity-associated transporter subunit PqiC [Myxococcales bacterium]